MKKIIQQFIEGRMKELLVLVKEVTQINLIERGLALLAIDIISALKKDGVAKIGCNCFRKIDLAITGTLRKKLSGEARDLVNEMVILDELGKEYGPNLNLIIDLSKKILDKQGTKFINEARASVAAVVG